MGCTGEGGVKAPGLHALGGEEEVVSLPVGDGEGGDHLGLHLQGGWGDIILLILLLLLLFLFLLLHHLQHLLAVGGNDGEVVLVHGEDDGAVAGHC